MENEKTIALQLPPQGAYKDRSGALVAFGILELLLALGCLLVVPLTLLSLTMRPAAPPPPGYAPPPAATLISTALVYLGMAAAFGWLGVGSIQARRWARTLNLVLGWIWLLCGTLGGAFMVALAPRMLATMPGMDRPGAKAFVQGCLAGTVGILFILLPLAFVLFNGGSNVRATVEARDPWPRWTDRCPPPVLALVLLYALAVFWCLAASLHPAVPAFGYLLTGAPAAAALVGFAVFEAAVAWFLYRLRPAAWWTVLAASLVGTLSSAMTLYRGIDWSELLRASGQPSNPMTEKMMTGLFQGPFLAIASALSSAAFLGYLLWIRRYFVPRPG